MVGYVGRGVGRSLLLFAISLFLLAAPAAGLLTALPTEKADGTGVGAPAIAAPSASAPAPAPATSASSDETPAATGADREGVIARLAWTESVSLEHLRHRAIEQVREYGGTTYLRPDWVGGFDKLPESAQRAAWRAWVFQAALGFSPGGFQSISPWQPQYNDAFQQADKENVSTAAPPAPIAAADLTPRGFKGLWSIESHGYPQQLITADQNGGTFLLTDQAILRFPAPGAAPTWIVKSEDYPYRAVTMDANGDGTLDLVVELASYIYFIDFYIGFTYGAELLVLDGATGDLLFENPSRDHPLQTWTLSDVDGDGVEDIIGTQTRFDYSTFSYEADLVALKLDGSLLYSKPVASYPGASTPTPFVSVGLYYDVFAGYEFADVNGDGVKDYVTSSGFDASVYVFLAAYEDASVPMVHAYDGRNGAEIWKRALDPAPGYSYLFPIGSGDLTGDQKEDVVFEYYQGYVFFPPVPVVYALTYADGVMALSGADGARLIEDVQRTAYASGSPIAPSVGEIDYYPELVADLDGDGRAEIVGAGFQDLAVVGRVPGTVPGGPSVEAYHVDLDLGEYEQTDGMFFVANVDSDAAQELVLHLVGLEMDEGGNITAIDTFLITADATGSTRLDFPALVGLYGFDEVKKQAYGWTVENDRWVPLDATGAAVADGLRLVTNVYPIDHRDVTGDGIPDLLLSKTIGFMWVDGATGRLLNDLARPSDRFLADIAEENGRVRILEADFNGNQYYFTDLTDLKEIWQFSESAFEAEDEYTYFCALSDLTGDGLEEALLFSANYRDDVYEDRVYDPLAKKVIWTVDGTERNVRFADYLPGRAGHEVLIESFGDEERTVELTHFGRNASLWTYTLVEEDEVSERLWGGAGGVIVVHTQSEEAEVFTFLDAQDGKVRSTYKPASPEINAGVSIDIHEDGESAVVVIHEMRMPEGGDYKDLTFKAIRWDWTTGKAFYSFPLRYEAPEETDGFVYIETPGFSGTTSDLNRDGSRELVFHELGRPVIREGDTGQVLAVGPENSWVMTELDLNGDGVDELALYNGFGRLRFVAYDAAATGPVDDDASGPIQRAVDPDSANATGVPKDFFEKPKKSFVPGAGMVLSLGALAVAAVALVRRSQRP